jgi:ribonuclease-3
LFSGAGQVSRFAASLERAIGYRFRRPALLKQALTHPSRAHENAGEIHYERLEFLGDAVLGFLLAELVYRRHLDLDEGDMTRLRARLVNARALADLAGELGLGRHLRLGRGERLSGGREKSSVLADALEAVIAAVFLDAGVRAARGLVRRLFRHRVDLLAATGGTDDAKTILQETLQARGQPRPVYRLACVTGPAHRRRFTVELQLGGKVVSRGQGSSRKEAEQQAAAIVLEDE